MPSSGSQTWSCWDAHIFRPSRRLLQYTAPILLRIPPHGAFHPYLVCLPVDGILGRPKHVGEYWVPIHWMVNAFVGFTFTSVIDNFSWLTSPMKQRRSAASTITSCQAIDRHSCNAHRSPTLDPILSQINPVRSLTRICYRYQNIPQWINTLPFVNCNITISLNHSDMCFVILKSKAFVSHSYLLKLKAHVSTVSKKLHWM
jgi:hypothetical protein